MVNMKNTFRGVKLHLMFAVLLVTFAACTSTGTEVSNPTDIPTSEGGSLNFDLSNAEAIVATDETATTTSSNLKKVVGSELQEIVSYVDANGQVIKDSGGTPLPSVTRIFTGPDGAVAFMLDSAISINDTDCMFFRGTTENESITCIDPDLTVLGEFVSTTVHTEFDEETLSYVDYNNVVQAVQFDAEGNIYYISGYVGLEGHNLYRWSFALGESEALIDESSFVYVREYLIVSDGSIFIQVTESIDPETEDQTYYFFKRLANGSVVNAPFESAHSFTIADEDTLLLSAHISNDNYGLYDVPFDALTFGDMEKILPFEDQSALEDSNGFLYEGLATSEWQKSSSGDVYALMLGLKDGSFDGTQIVKVFPDEVPSFVDTTLESIVFFRLVDDVFYIAGEDEDGINNLVKMSLGDIGSSESLLDEDIQIYNMVIVDNKVIFDGLKTDDDTIIVGQIDMNDGNALTELSEEEAHLLGLQSINN